MSKGKLFGKTTFRLALGWSDDRVSFPFDRHLSSVSRLGEGSFFACILVVDRKTTKSNIGFNSFNVSSMVGNIDSMVISNDINRLNPQRRCDGRGRRPGDDAKNGAPFFWPPCLQDPRCAGNIRPPATVRHCFRSKKTPLRLKWSRRLFSSPPANPRVTRRKGCVKGKFRQTGCLTGCGDRLGTRD